MTVRIRPAQLDDIPDIRAVVSAAFTPYIARIGKEPAPMSLDLEMMVTRGCVHVADTGKMVGVIVMEPAGRDWYVDTIAIHPEQTGTGLGRTLMDAAEEAAIRNGATRLILYTNAHMSEAIAFHRKLGLRETHRISESGFNRIYFAKSLSR